MNKYNACLAHTFAQLLPPEIIAEMKSAIFSSPLAQFYWFLEFHALCVSVKYSASLIRWQNRGT